MDYHTNADLSFSKLFIISSKGNTNAFNAHLFRVIIVNPSISGVCSQGTLFGWASGSSSRKKCWITQATIKFTNEKLMRRSSLARRVRRHHWVVELAATYPSPFHFLFTESRPSVLALTYGSIRLSVGFHTAICQLLKVALVEFMVIILNVPRKVPY